MFKKRQLTNCLGWLIAILCCIPLSMSAANGGNSKDIYYFGEYHLGYGTSSSVNGYSTYTGNVLLGTVQGVRYKEYFQLGIGADAQMYTHYYKGQGIRYGVIGYGDARFSYPVTDEFFVTLGGSFGAQFPIKPSGGGNPFYMEIGPGLIYKNLLFKTGLQKIGSGDGTSHFIIKIGFHF